MIVIGVDVHKHSLTAVAVDEVGRPLGERTVVRSSDGLLAWAAALGEERLWAVEDCRQLTRGSSGSSRGRRGAGAGAAEADGAGAPRRQGPRQTRARLTRTLTWDVRRGTILRLQQLLAETGYLPVEWTPAGEPVARTPQAQLAAAIDPPAGRFRSPCANAPKELRGIWRTGKWNHRRQARRYGHAR